MRFSDSANNDKFQRVFFATTGQPVDRGLLLRLPGESWPVVIS
jgi:hypothetical protein